MPIKKTHCLRRGLRRQTKLMPVGQIKIIENEKAIAMDF
jgi:hypothetical protein